jgi:DNA polymerase-3 subunit alpha
VIIADRPIIEYTPLHRPTKGNDESGIGVVTQFPMEILESIGLLKIDFLGLSTLTVMRHACDLIAERHGLNLNLDNIPYDRDQPAPDPSKPAGRIFDLLASGNVLGVFQVEGTGMRRVLTDLKPQRFEHVIAVISLFRPGPMENIPAYIRRMHGGERIEFRHPDLEAILAETYGIIVYQEQIIQLAVKLAGYEPGEADMIRKAVAKKKRKLMDEHKLKFISGAVERGYSEDICQAIWDDVEFFARYGFNKAHAADYAVITCQTAYLKAWYPLEYMAALLTVERHNTDKIALYVADCRRMGISVLPPDINASGSFFAIANGGEGREAIRFGLSAIKNVGEGAVDVLLEARDAGGPFRDLDDLAERVDLRRIGKRALECLIQVGALESLGGSRAQQLSALDRIMRVSQQAHEQTTQMNMFAMSGFATPSTQLQATLPQVEAIGDHQKRQLEKELIGFCLTAHPMQRMLDDLDSLVTAYSGDLPGLPTGKPVVMSGIVSWIRPITTRSGYEMAKIGLEDIQGDFELVVFSRAWERYRELVAVGKVLLVRGDVDNSRGDPSVRVQSLTDRPTVYVPLDGGSGAYGAMAAEEEVIALDGPPSGLSGGNGGFARPAGPPPPPPPPPDEWSASQDLREAPTAVDQNRSSQSVTVVLQAAGLDELKPLMRRLVQLLDIEDGADRFRMQVEGMDVVFDFPNIKTHWTPQLGQQVSALRGVRAVRVE